MQAETARAIADLINDRNQLTVKYTAKKVLDAADNYLCRFAGDAQLLGVVEVKRVQWYQCEIDHLSVRADAEGQGIASSLVKEAEERIVELGARIAQCTIRVGNNASEALFQKFGYLPSVTFLNARSGNEVTVYQKALVTR
jgi:ribosomal protein S18 acetylase RimI-like enzyme